MEKILIVGIGNVGKEYEQTRHNIGFLFIDLLASKMGSLHFLNDHFSSLANVKDGKRSLFLMKPNTFVNLSGKAVASWKNFYKATNEQIFVVYDDASMDFGKIKIVKDGGSGGHNGIKSITSAIGGDYFRIKFGVKKPFAGDMKDFVLSKISGEEVLIFNKKMGAVCDNLELLMQRDTDSFSRILNDVALSFGGR